MHSHSPAKAIFLILFAIAQFIAPGLASAQTGDRCPGASKSPAAVSLDGVQLEICTAFIDAAVFFQPDPTQANQITYASDPDHPERQLSILAIPAGARSGVEDLPPVDTARGGEGYLAYLRENRQNQGGNPRPGPRAVLFGQVVEGLVSDLPATGIGTGQLPMRVIEWTVISGTRLWIVRESQLAGNPPFEPAPSDGINGPPLELWQVSDDAGPTLSPAAVKPVIPLTSTSGLTPLAFPAWWQGSCDITHYAYATNNPTHIPSYPLGANFRGLVACGPRPWFDHAPDVLVRYFTGAWGELEWECVELSMRYLYLAYGIPPYQANGNKVVANYTGTGLVKIANNTVGVAPQPGDVLSYCAACTVGHTSVVMASSVDATGNGYVTVIEQNNSANGQSTLSVRNWLVVGNSGEVIGWLHQPQTTIEPPIRSFLPLISLK